jgi:hypothetical protein
MLIPQLLPTNFVRPEFRPAWLFFLSDVRGLGSLLRTVASKVHMAGVSPNRSGSEDERRLVGISCRRLAGAGPRTFGSQSKYFLGGYHSAKAAGITDSIVSAKARSSFLYAVKRRQVAHPKFCGN